MQSTREHNHLYIQMLNLNHRTFQLEKICKIKLIYGCELRNFMLAPLTKTPKHSGVPPDVKRVGNLKKRQKAYDY